MAATTEEQHQTQEQTQTQEQNPSVKDDVLAVKDDVLAVKDDVLAVKDDVLAVKDMNVTIVQDVSGSMEDQRRSVVTGMNEIIGEMKSRYKSPCPYNATFRIIKFSSRNRIHVGDAISVHDVQPMNPDDLVCDGMTALWDAVATAIKLMNEESIGVPATTYIFSDGDNNDSTQYTQSGVNEMIAENKKKNPMHSILFIGSDPSTKRNASGMGLDRVHSIQHDSENTPVAYHVCSRALGRCISGDTQSTEFNDDDILMSETPHLQRCDQPASSDDYAFASDDLASDVVPSRTWSSSQ
jgi:uncharacterized protein YegL